MSGTMQLGLVGLGVMGRNLALNLGEHGVAVTGLDANAASTVAARDQGIETAADRAELLARLASPRRILLMIPAGAGVDAELEALLPQLAPGDLVIDGGNSFWRDSLRRAASAEALGIGYVDAGVSGGEEGARSGPAIMAGCTEKDWAAVGPMLAAIAARAPDGAACCARVGPNGAGHFVKMVHNGIEYAVMQLLAELYDYQRRVLGLSTREQAERFDAWNDGPLGSFLVEATARVLGTMDPRTDRPLVEVIKGVAEQKGTGGWAAIAALELGVPVPTLIEAVQARALSAFAALRVTLGRETAPVTKRSEEATIALDQALLSAILLTYAQGFHLIAVAGAERQWGIDARTVAGIWRAGCIIRAKALDLVADVSGAEHLLLHAPYRLAVAGGIASLRGLVGAGAAAGLPLPAHASALAYDAALRTADLPANLIQGLRDLFGAHQFERNDRPGRFHHDWSPKP